MGQPIEVTSQPGSRPQVVFFEINRSLTGMKIEEYRSPADAEGDRWVDELARRLGALGVTRLTIYSSSVVAEAPDWSDIRDEAERTIEQLYVYYREGKIPEGDYTGAEDSGDSGGSGDSGDSGDSGEAETADA